jgi:hypothetical protein
LKEERFERLLRKIVTQVMSYHDFSSVPERVYHAMVLEILVWMSGKCNILSNRESGYGHYDIMMKPKDIKKAGIVMEFKLVEKEGETEHEAVLDEAFETDSGSRICYGIESLRHFEYSENRSGLPGQGIMGQASKEQELLTPRFWKFK